MPMIATRDIIDASDAILVAEALGIPMQKIGSRISILCPQHEDRHFGSCFLNEHGYHCFACHARGSAIDLVRQVNQVNFFDACKFVAEMFGCENLLGVGGEGEDKPFHRPLPDKNVLTLLGLSDVYTIKGVVEAISPYSPLANTKDMRKALTFEPQKDGEGMYLLEEVIARRPMQGLCDEDPAMLDYIILNKAVELKERYKKMLDYKADDFLNHHCEMVIEKSGKRAFENACKRALTKLDEVITEYGMKYDQNVKRDAELADLPVPSFRVSGKDENRKVFGGKKKRIGVR